MRGPGRFVFFDSRPERKPGAGRSVTRRWVRPLAALVLAAGLSMASAAFLSTAAQAQMTDDVLLVGNFESTQHLFHYRTEPVSQRFTTGTQIHGFALKSVKVAYRDSQGDRVSAKVCTVTGADQPTSTCTDFTGPTSFESGDITFTAPGGFMYLAKRTKYAVVLTPDESGAEITYHTTPFQNNDSGSLFGWEIADAYRFYDGTSWPRDGENRSIRIRLRGSIIQTANANAEGAPDITGPAQVGGTLTAGKGTIYDPDGLPTGRFPNGYLFQWIRVDSSDNETDIAGATSDTYTPVTTDVGHTLKVRVRFVDRAVTLETVTGGATPPVVPDAAPCPAVSVWCAVLTSGANPPGFSAGGGTIGENGSLDDDTFTFGGTGYTVTDILSGGTHSIYLATEPDLPADGGGLTLHVQRLNGTLDLPLADGSLIHQDGVGGNSWEFFYVTETGPTNPSLLRLSTRINEAYTDATEAVLSHAVSGGDYGANSVTASSVDVTVGDDETASTTVALSVNPTSVDEDAGTTSVTVTGTLDGAPRTADTVVTVSVGATGDGAAEGTDYGTVADLTLTVDAGETTGTAMFTLTPTDDDVDESDETLSVTGTATGLTLTGTTATIVDDDERGVTVSAPTLTVPEGSTATYTVVLTSQPTATVTVTPSRSSGSGDVTFSPASLSFGTGDWNTAKTVTVSAAEDDDAEADEAVLSHAVSGGDYGANSVTASSVDVTVGDNETASTTVALSVNPASVAEDAGGTTVTVTGTLDGAPRTVDTVVTVSVGATGDGATEGTDYGTVADLTLTVDAGETTGTATFTLTPTDDDVDEDDETLSVTGTTTATGLTVTATTATIVDDDTRGVTVSAPTLTVPEGSTATYTVVLTSQPTATVTVTPSRSSGSGDVTFSPASLSFGTGDWNTAKTVTVSAAEDDDAEADEAVLSHAVSGGDYGANSVTASSVDVTVGDNETASTTVALSVNPASVDEDAGATTVTVTGTLDGAPRTADTVVTVTVGASSDDAAEGTDYGTVADLTLTVDAGETTGTATFTLTPTDDDVDEDDETLSVTLLDSIEERGRFPSPRVRWCTSSLKRGPIERELRRYLKANPRFGGRIVSAMGMRAGESPARARKPPWRLTGISLATAAGHDDPLELSRT